MPHADSAHEHYDVAVQPDRRIALQLLCLTAEENPGLKSITRVISADPALSLRILALANAMPGSALGAVATVPHALRLIGPTLLRSVASTAAVQLFSPGRTHGEDGSWVHAVTAAVAAARVARYLQSDPSEALTAALLHDIGEDLLRNRNPERFDDVARALVNESPRTRLRIEQRMLGIDHATLGARVLLNLGLPSTLADAVRAHHVVGSGGAPCARAVRVADCVAKLVTGDSDSDLDAVLRATRVATTADRLVAQTERDRRALLEYLADFTTPLHLRER